MATHSFSVVGIERMEREGRYQASDVPIVVLTMAGQIIMLGAHQHPPLLVSRSSVLR
jgi:hypothetical protein